MFKRSTIGTGVRSADVQGQSPQVVQPAQPPRQQPRHAPSGDFSMWLAKLGMWLVVLSFGGIFFAINGGFSVIGLGVIANSFNEAGALFWAAATSIVFHMPVAVQGLSTTQPTIPWIGVVAASLLQIVVVWRKLQGKPIPAWLIFMASLLSVYDAATTYFGFGTVDWIKKAGMVVQVPLSLLFTFGLEITIGFLLRRRNG